MAKIQIHSDSARYILLAIWLGGLVTSVLPIIVAYSAIKGLFEDFLGNMAGAFGSQLTLMLAFLFARTSTQNDTVNTPSALLAIVLSLLYIGIFVGIALAFSFRHLRADEAIELIQTNGLRFAFLINGALAYYFASESKSGAHE